MSMRSKTNKILFVVFLGIVFVLVILSVVSFEEAYHQYLSGDDILYVSTRIVDGMNIELWVNDREGNPMAEPKGVIDVSSGECYLNGKKSYVFDFDSDLLNAYVVGDKEYSIGYNISCDEFDLSEKQIAALSGEINLSQYEYLSNLRLYKLSFVNQYCSESIQRFFLFGILAIVTLIIDVICLLSYVIDWKSIPGKIEKLQGL